mmetsp:Transcript_996/g.1789  ORF Transcript_996/g.1789 Transcript_996/m.1789 type:complete len:131 (+) Transcript_996:1260-1652(+)
MAEGIGIARITDNFDKARVDGAVKCSDQEIMDMINYLKLREGIYVGPSAALNVLGAVKLAKILGPGKTVATIICDGGDRYNSKLQNESFLTSLGLTNDDFEAGRGRIFSRTTEENETLASPLFSNYRQQK